MMIGKHREGHDLGLQSLKRLTKMGGRPDAAKRQDTLALKRCEWQDVSISQRTEVNGFMLATEQRKRWLNEFQGCA